MIDSLVADASMAANYRGRIEDLEKELAELKSQHKEAVDRIKDLLLGDDGQACKEAERYLDKISKKRS